MLSDLRLFLYTPSLDILLYTWGVGVMILFLSYELPKWLALMWLSDGDLLHSPLPYRAINFPLSTHHHLPQALPPLTLIPNTALFTFHLLPFTILPTHLPLPHTHPQTVHPRPTTTRQFTQTPPSPLTLPTHPPIAYPSSLHAVGTADRVHAVCCRVAAACVADAQGLCASVGGAG
jgi:hypothetical protein